MAPIQRQRRRGFNSRPIAKTSSDRTLLQTASGKPFQTRGAAAAKERIAEGRVHSDHFQHLTSSNTCLRTTTTMQPSSSR